MTLAPFPSCFATIGPLGPRRSSRRQPLSGPPIVGSLVALDANRVTLGKRQRSSLRRGPGRLAERFRQGNSRRSSVAASLGRNWSTVRRSGSGRLPCAQGRARIEPSVGEAIDLPVDNVARFVRFQPAAVAVLDQWDRLLKMKAPPTFWWSQNRSCLITNKGTIHDVTDKQV